MLLVTTYWSGDSHLRHISTRGEGGSKPEDFRGDAIYGWPPNVSKSVIRESVIENLRKRARKRSFNVSSHKHGVTKPLNVRSIVMTSIYFHELVLLFFISHHNFYNNNVDNFLKGYVRCNNFSRNEFLNYDSFIYHDFNIFSVSHKCFI